MDVSIIIPMYNSSKTIERTLDSIMNQTFSNYEVYITDDGSTDNSYDIVQRYISKYELNNFHLNTQRNSGVSKARNVGMKLAKGNYIAFLDSDDEWLPTKLEQQIKLLQNNPAIDLLGTARNGELYREKFFPKSEKGVIKLTTPMLLYKMFLITPTIIFKREILNTIGYFDEESTHSEDSDFYIRISSQYNCFLLNKDLVITGGGKRHFGEKGLSSNLIEMEKGELRNFRKAYKRGDVSFLHYLSASVFSMVKFSRRLVLNTVK